jgi:hypothetical protein
MLVVGKIRRALAGAGCAAAFVPAARGFVRALADRHGFEVVHHATDDAEARALYVFGFGDSLANFSRAQPFGPVLYRLGAGLARAQLALGLSPRRLDSHSFVLRKWGQSSGGQSSGGQASGG